MIGHLTGWIARYLPLLGTSNGPDHVREEAQGREGAVQEPTAVRHLFEALTFPTEELPGIYSETTLGTLHHAAREILDLCEEANQADLRPETLLTHRARLVRRAHTDAMGGLLESASETEFLIRSTAWALDAERPWNLRVKAVNLSQDDIAQGADALIANSIRGGGHAVWWMTRAPIPDSLMDLARTDNLLLIGDGNQAGPEAKGSNLLLGTNPALIEVPSVDGRTRILSLSGASPILQALLAGRTAGAWYEIRPPAGFSRLERDCLAPEARDLMVCGLIAAVKAGLADNRIAIHADFLPKPARTSRWSERVEELTRLTEGEEGRMSRLRPVINYPKEVSGADPMSLGTISIVAPFNVPVGGRTKSELERGLGQLPVNSVGDICRGFNIRMEANVKDVDGETIHLSIPVDDEDTFTPDGMTRKDPTLFKWYVRYRTYEECMRYLSEHGRDRLTGDEITKLQTMRRFLAEAERSHE